LIHEPPPVNCLHPVVIERRNHPISRRLIDPDALKVLYRLSNHGYKGYLVGGSVRDMLLGKEPKDFDVATDASPREIRALFRNCRVIGRRFRLAHIYFHGGKIIEVSTFRKSINMDDKDGDNGDNGNGFDPEIGDVENGFDPENGDVENGFDPENGDEESGDKVTSRKKKERPPTENDFGTETQDALRRDITINALFYNIANYSIIDYVGGINDLEKGLVRSVGCPHRSFTEDPVRIMRVLRHSARTDFPIESETYSAISEHLPKLTKCPEARVREEFLRDLRGGWARKCIKLMIETGLLYYLFPEYENVLRGPGAHVFAHFLATNLKGIDSINNSGGSISDTMLMTVFFAPFVRHAHIMDRAPVGKGRTGFIHEQVKNLIKPLIRGFGFSKGRAEHVSQSIFGMLLVEETARFGGKVPRSLFTKQYFNDGYKLYRIECIGRDEAIPNAIRRAAEGLIDRKNSSGKPRGDNGEAEKKSRAPRRRYRRRSGSGHSQPPKGQGEA
jgi:poly(A) polymerase